eukprot:TRINITY_DN109_c0_g2_i1.p1 TRINITY_DN109_c0_g2~~TRINITY_DN109_c0_g2_i1.p1  ORF type:complete len:694 (+),score=86.24 TRINITY_DN109_c0_g2_i1:40-2082(+)
MGSKSDRKKDRSRKSKKRHRSSPDSSSEDSLERDAQKRRKLEKLTRKIEKHWKKHHIAPQYTSVNVGNSLGIVDESSQNPFNDANIGERFVWRKKVQQELEKGIPLQQFSAAAEQERQKARMEEWEKVKLRREKRESEKAQQQEELSQVQRERAAAEAQLLINREEHFHLSQAIDRAQRRISENRQRSIDRLIRNLHLWKKLGVDEEDPSLIVESLGKQELLQLGEDIKELSEVDTKDELHRDYWIALKNIWEIKLDQLNKQGNYGDGSHYSQRRLGIVEEELKEMMEGKSLSQLQQLQQQILKQEEVDPDFFQSAKQMIAVFKAQARLREINLQVLERYYNWKRQQQVATDAVQEQDILDIGEGVSADIEDIVETPVDVGGEAKEKFEELYSFLGRGGPKVDVGPSLVESDGRFSPPPLQPSEIPRDVIVMSSMEDLRQIFNRRCQIQAKMVQDYATVGAKLEADGGSKQREYHQMIMDKPVQPILRYIADAAPQSGEKSFRSGRDEESVDIRMIAQARKAMGPASDGDNDRTFAQEYILQDQPNSAPQSTWFNLKYQPRKPKYFNRVHTGYEWNKYNQTHYDADNPPPKVVQGYKFNIFYPDLIDKIKAPVYRVERDPDSKDGSTCVLRFTAGPPYEDIAFRIVNKEWEYSHKRGFKCVWERDMLQLYFNFKRQRYRR